MRLRYKKAIILIFISTMLIGGITILILPNHNSKESMKYNHNYDNVVESISPSPTKDPGLSITPSLTPSPSPLPVYQLETVGYPEITKLMKDYYKAKLSCDITSLKKLLSDPSDVGTKKELKKKVQYFDKISNIKCYVKKSFKEGTYIVYVYNEVKFINIKTPAPAVYQFYIVTDSTGKLKIFSGTLDEETNQYYYERKNDSDVQKLIKDTNKKAEKAKKSDKSLKTFWNNLIKAQTMDETDGSKKS